MVIWYENISRCYGRKATVTANATVARHPHSVKPNEKFQPEVRENKDLIFLPLGVHGPSEFYLQAGGIYYLPDVNVYLLDWKEARNILVMKERQTVKQYVA